MDAEDQISVTRNSCPRVLGRRPAVPGKRPRSRSSRNASKRRRSPRGMLRERALGELVQPFGRDIRSQLAIPMRRIELREPAAKPFELSRRESFDGAFDLLDFPHDPNPCRSQYFTPPRGQRLPGAVAGATGMEEIRP